MKNFHLLLAAGLLSPLAFAQEIPGEYIVELLPNAPLPGLLRAHGISASYTYDAALNGFAATLNDGQLNALQRHPSVLSIVPNRLVQLDSESEPQASIVGASGLGDGIPAGVSRIGAGPNAVYAARFTGTGVGVAIVDTGLDFEHTDLPVQLETQPPALATSYSAFGGSAQDDQGHGTHVGGIVAAENNGADVVGVAYGATLYAVKVLDAAGSGSDAAIIAGLNWVANNAAAMSPKIKVVNMSLGRRGSVTDNPSLRKAVQSLTGKGITVIVAAGNSCSVQVNQQVPACYPEVLAIASTTAQAGTSAPGFPVLPQDMASYFTTDGAYKTYKVQGKNYTMGVTISAPGETMENVIAGGYIESVGILSLALGGGTVEMSGSSMAAPHAAGVAALLYQQNASLTPETVRAKFRSSAVSIGVAPRNTPTTCYSYDGQREGVLNAARALGF
jgi:subtilisin